MPAAVAPATPADSLRLEHCPACGYDLTGLPADGVCPECGQPYDAGTVELTGTARGSHVTFVNGSRSHVLWRVPWIVVFAGLVGYWIWVVGHAFPKASLPVAAMLVVWWLGPAVGVVRRSVGGRGVVRLRMNFAGIVQDDDASEPPAATTVRAVMPYVVAVMCAALFVWLIVSRFWMAALILAGLAGPGATSWWQSARLRRQILGTPDDMLLASGARRRLLLPARWRSVATVHIEMETDDTCRIVTTSRAGGKAGHSGDVSDIEVRFTPQQAAELRSRVTALREYWRNKKR